MKGKAEHAETPVGTYWFNAEPDQDEQRRRRTVYIQLGILVTAAVTIFGLALVVEPELNKHQPVRQDAGATQALTGPASR